MVLDIIGQFLLYLMCITPVFTISFAWKIVEKKLSVFYWDSEWPVCYPFFFSLFC